MKILFLGDYSNLHACLASQLRKLGHDVTVVSDGGLFMHTAADRLLFRKPGKWGTAAYAVKTAALVAGLRGYDHVQLINTNFLKLRPGKLEFIFTAVKRRNGAVGLTLAGNDPWYVRACLDGRFAFSEFRVGGEPTGYARAHPNVEREWLCAGNLRLSDRIASGVGSAVSVLPEYDAAGRGVLGAKLSFINIPVEMEALPAVRPIASGGKPVRVFIGIKDGTELQKGTGRLLEALRGIERNSKGGVEVECACNYRLEDYLERMARADLVVDQLYGASPATNALQAMAMGKAVATSLLPIYCNALGRRAEENPVIGLHPGSAIEEVLERAVSDRGNLARRGAAGPEWVRKHNGAETVARKFLKAIGG